MENISSAISKIKLALEALNIKGYLVGGIVRDLLLNRKTNDIDIAIDQNPLKVGPELAKILGGTFVPLDETNLIARIVLNNWQIDLNYFDKDITADLARRDFTINALAVPIEKVQDMPASVIDSTGGLADLKQTVIRMVRGDIFEQDPARLLRAVRLSLELGFTIESETRSKIKASSHLLAKVAGEKIREELLKILRLVRSAEAFLYMDQLGLTRAIIPELETLKGVEQPKEHQWDVFNHSLQSIDGVDYVLRKGGWPYAQVLDSIPWSDEIGKHFNEEISYPATRRELLKLSALLHDIAKPETKTIIKGRVRFPGHPKLGAAKVGPILERLRFSNKEVRVVEKVVYYHLRPVQLGEDLPSDRALYRYFRDTGDETLDALFFSLADHLATRGPELDEKDWGWHTRVAGYIVEKYFEPAGIKSLPKLLDGHIIMDKFNLSPGPLIGQLLGEIKEAQASGEVKTTEEALAYAEKLLLSPHFLKDED